MNHDYNNLQFKVIPYKTNKNINFKINYDSKIINIIVKKKASLNLQTKKDELGINK